MVSSNHSYLMYVIEIETCEILKDFEMQTDYPILDLVSIKKKNVISWIMLVQPTRVKIKKGKNTRQIPGPC